VFVLFFVHHDGAVTIDSPTRCSDQQHALLAASILQGLGRCPQFSNHHCINAREPHHVDQSSGSRMDDYKRDWKMAAFHQAYASRYSAFWLRKDWCLYGKTASGYRKTRKPLQ
jgi:hypothetical protein